MTEWQLPLWQSLLPLGRHEATGGYRRFSFTSADLACRDWFRREAERRGLRVETDRNGNLWAWWDPPQGPAELPRAIVTGSHLDSVPDGGAFDGPLGIVSALVAIDLLREAGQVPGRRVGVVAFTEEEGARFGTACLGSKLLTGALDPDAARSLADRDGVSLAEAMSEAGLDPDGIGPDPERLEGIDAFIELHIEQGRSLAETGAAVGVAESIWPHGRWRIEFTGRADHAGTTKLTDRRDPMLPYGATVLAARTVASELGALATFGRVTAEPGGTNVISSAVHAWLDARAPDEEKLKDLVSQVTAVAELSGTSHGVTASSTCESLSPMVEFDLEFREQVLLALSRRGIDAPVLPTGAGHDAGVLAGRLSTAMLFVRNPTGVSHAPAEHAEPEDCEAGIVALAAVLTELACQ